MEDSFLPSPHEQKYVHRLKERKIDYINIERDEHITTYYTMYKVMGKGSYGIVYAARENRNNSVWAIKILTKKEGNIKSFEREIEILKFVDHPNIIRLNSIVESLNSVYLVLDLCDGVLSDLFKSRKFLTEVETRGIIKELSSAASYLHNNGIVHRDIKMENILLINDDSVKNERKISTKLTDFGLSTVKTGTTYHYQDMMHDRCGTFSYMAPEIIISRSYSHQCDVWAIGVLLYTLLSGEFPFAGTSENVIKDAIIRQESPLSTNMKFRKLEEPNYTILKVDLANVECVVDLVQRLLHKDPAHRSTAIEIVDHPWIRERHLNELKNGNVLNMMAQWRQDLNVHHLNKSSDVTEAQSASNNSKKKMLQKVRRTSHKTLTSSKSSQKPKKSGMTSKRITGLQVLTQRLQQSTIAGQTQESILIEAGIRKRSDSQQHSTLGIPSEISTQISHYEQSTHRKEYGCKSKPNENEE